MAYDFKKLSAVETVETVSDTASVLVEENGVIKKAPKNKVGGSGIVITVRSEDGLEVTAPEGLYEQLKTMFDTQAVTSDISVYNYNGEEFYFCYVNNLYRAVNNDDIDCLIIVAGSYGIEVFQDGRVNCFYYD